MEEEEPVWAEEEPQLTEQNGLTEGPHVPLKLRPDLRKPTKTEINQQAAVFAPPRNTSPDTQDSGAAPQTSTRGQNGVTTEKKNEIKRSLGTL